MIYSIKNKTPIYGKYIKEVKYNSPLDKTMVVTDSNILLCQILQWDCYYNYYKVNAGKCYFSTVKSYNYQIYEQQYYQNDSWYYKYTYMNNYYDVYVIPLLVSQNKQSVRINKKQKWDSEEYNYFTTGYYQFQYKNRTWYCNSWDQRNDCGTVQQQRQRQWQYGSQYRVGNILYYQSPWYYYWYGVKINSINNSLVTGNSMDVSTQNFSNKLVMIENAKLVIDKYNFAQKYSDQTIPDDWKITQ